MVEMQLIDKDEYLALAREMVSCLEKDQMTDAQRILEEFARARESYLFQELGKLTREFHEALQGFNVDTNLANIAEQDIPDAKERLNYVIKMTDEAANQSLGAVESCMPICDNIEENSKQLIDEWKRFIRREMDPKDFRQLSQKVVTFLAVAESDSATLKANLNDVLMAQGFQDLTGQIIRRVIKLVNDVENSLVNLIKMSSQRGLGVKDHVEKKSELHGPVVPGLDKDSVQNQDEVDDLLSSLGF